LHYGFAAGQQSDVLQQNLTSISLALEGLPLPSGIAPDPSA
jgi:hypothetical protein